jgi:hypothetical protein
MVKVHALVEGKTITRSFPNEVASNAWMTAIRAIYRGHVMFAISTYLEGR